MRKPNCRRWMLSEHNFAEIGLYSSSAAIGRNLTGFVGGNSCVRNGHRPGFETRDRPSRRWRELCFERSVFALSEESNGVLTSFRYSVLACSQSLEVGRPRSVWTNPQRSVSRPGTPTVVGKATRWQSRWHTHLRSRVIDVSPAAYRWSLAVAGVSQGGPEISL